MNTKRQSFAALMVAAMVFLVGLAAPVTAGPTPVGTAFTYQGQLKHSGANVNASADFEFRLYDVGSGGSPTPTATGDAAANDHVQAGER